MSLKPYYEDGAAGIVLYCGDCREILPQIETGGGSMKTTLILTDPPYGVDAPTKNASSGRGFRLGAASKDYKPVHGDNKPFDPAHLLGFTNAVLWGANHYASRLPDSHCWFCWDRKVTEDGSDITDCELAWVAGLPYKTTRIFRHLWAGFRRGSEVGEQHVHPTQKPVQLMEWCLSFFPDVTLVVDPYCGSGPVLRAAKDLRRRAVGIEIEEAYCEATARRLQQEVLPL